MISFYIAFSQLIMLVGILAFIFYGTVFLFYRGKNATSYSWGGREYAKAGLISLCVMLLAFLWPIAIPAFIVYVIWGMVKETRLLNLRNKP